MAWIKCCSLSELHSKRALYAEWFSTPAPKHGQIHTLNRDFGECGLGHLPDGTASSRREEFRNGHAGDEVLEDGLGHLPGGVQHAGAQLPQQVSPVFVEERVHLRPEQLVAVEQTVELAPEPVGARDLDVGVGDGGVLLAVVGLVQRPLVAVVQAEVGEGEVGGAGAGDGQQEDAARGAVRPGHGERGERHVELVRLPRPAYLHVADDAVAQPVDGERLPRQVELDLAGALGEGHPRHHQRVQVADPDLPVAVGQGSDAHVGGLLCARAQLGLRGRPGAGLPEVRGQFGGVAAALQYLQGFSC